ncbi:glycosyltransferase family 4 protein [Microbacterium sp. MC2]
MDRYMVEHRLPSHPTYVVAHPGSELFGSDRMMLESVRGMTDAGARVIVVLPEDGPLVQLLTDAGAEVVRLPMLVLRKALVAPSGWPILVSRAFQGTRAAWRLLRRVRPATLYVSTITIPQWPLIARLLRLRTVSHVHEAEASASRLLNRLLYLPLLASTTVLVNSEFSLETIRVALPRLARRARVIYNGVAGPTTVSAPRSDVEELRVLYVGRLSPRKGVDDLVRAISILVERGRKVRLSVLGSAFTGYEWYEQELRTLAGKVPAAIDFLGFRSDVWSVLAEHDVLVVPSRLDEPFGNTAVEGILAHRPVVASDTSGLREAAGGYPTTRLVSPGSPHALADALQEIHERWTTILPLLTNSAESAARRHSLTMYRTTVLAAVGSGAGQPQSDYSSDA